MLHLFYQISNTDPRKKAVFSTGEQPSTLQILMITDIPFQVDKLSRVIDYL